MLKKCDKEINKQIRKIQDSINKGQRQTWPHPLTPSLGLIDLSGISWVIVGGESGSKARPMKPTWVINIKDQCRKQGSIFFFKQWGRWGADGIKRSKKANGRLLLGRIWDNKPQKLVEPVAARWPEGPRGFTINHLIAG